MIVGEKVLADPEGFISTRPIRLERASNAIVTRLAEIGPGWPPWRKGLAKIRVEATGGDPARSIFLGIAESDDVQAYLADVAYDEIVNFELRPLRVSYRRQTGSSAPATPATQRFWRVFAQGPGPQTIEWDVEPGEWVLVLMNADGSAGIDLEGSVGAKVPWLFWVGLGLLIAGAIFLALGIFMIYFAIRRPGWNRRPELKPLPDMCSPSRAS